MKNFFGGLLFAAGAVALTVGVIAGIERLLKDSSPAPRATPEAPPQAPPPAETLVKEAERNFSIKRTKSEVGYVYWILEGYGKYKCFVLCDTWDEAVAQAKAKLAEVDGVEQTSETASTLA
jgi:hypothetical protein